MLCPELIMSMGQVRHSCLYGRLKIHGGDVLPDQIVHAWLSFVSCLSSSSSYSYVGRCTTRRHCERRFKQTLSVVLGITQNS